MGSVKALRGARVELGYMFPSKYLHGGVITMAHEWLVKITVVRDGVPLAENIYEYENEADAMDSAFGACQEALTISTEQHAQDIHD